MIWHQNDKQAKHYISTCSGFCECLLLQTEVGREKKIYFQHTQSVAFPFNIKNSQAASIPTPCAPL